MKLNFDQFLNRKAFSAWQSQFDEIIRKRTDPARHGDLASWLNTLSKLPKLQASVNYFNQKAVTIGSRQDLSHEEYQQLDSALRELTPWRKGPYNLFDVQINTEWRSDWKWDRLSPYISDLKNRRVLDVGCGNGYHCWRMLGAGAKYILGIDPSIRFLMQYMAVQYYAQQSNIDFVPIGIEDMPTDMALFDSIFSMGVLYHRREPINHLTELKQLLVDGGELILETLIVDQADDGIVKPKERYAKMRNVWSILTVDKAIELLLLAGFNNPRCVDKTITTTDEQRATQWMQFHSLNEFLDPNDKSKTVEGYPAPKRAIFIATK